MKKRIKSKIFAFIGLFICIFTITLTSVKAEEIENSNESFVYRGEYIINSNYLNSIYFNVGLSNNEIDNLFDNLIFSKNDFYDYGIYYVFVSDLSDKLFYITKNDNTYTFYYCYDNTSNYNLDGTKLVLYDSINGWSAYSKLFYIQANNLINYYIDVNEYGRTSFDYVKVGLQNSNLSSVLSSTYFIKYAYSDYYAIAKAEGYNEGYQALYNDVYESVKFDIMNQYNIFNKYNFDSMSILDSENYNLNDSLFTYEKLEYSYSSYPVICNFNTLNKNYLTQLYNLHSFSNDINITYKLNFKNSVLMTNYSPFSIMGFYKCIIYFDDNTTLEIINANNVNEYYNINLSNYSSYITKHIKAISLTTKDINYNNQFDLLVSCMSSQYSLGYQAGLQDEENNSFNYNEGFNAGLQDNTNNNNYYDYGYQAGYQTGFNDKEKDVEEEINNSFDNGYQAGYQTGFNDGVNEENPTTMKTLFWSIANIPVNYISSIFGFELFGINLFSALCSVISLLLVIWVVRKFI